MNASAYFPLSFGLLFADSTGLIYHPLDSNHKHNATGQGLFGAFPVWRHLSPNSSMELT